MKNLPTRLFIYFSIALLGCFTLGLPAPLLSETLSVFSLSTSPALPVAGDQVSISVLPGNFATTTTSYTWFRGDTAVPSASGVGRSSFLIATDPTRSEVIRVRVQVNPGSGFTPTEQTVTIFTIPSQAGQEATLQEIQANFSLEASEINPSPNENVTVSVVTFAFDRGQANYQWLVNGKSLADANGRGRYQISVPSGNEGETKTILVSVTTPSGLVRSKSITLKTVSASLYWWADTVTPYWYKGKALPSLHAATHVLALTSARSANDLAYQWSFNDSPVSASSGFGKSVFRFTFDFPVPERIGVTMKDITGAFSKTTEIAVEPVKPFVGIYAAQPLRGTVFEKELVDVTLPAGDTYDFTASPFFFPQEQEEKLTFLWTLNGKEITGTFAKPWLFTLDSRAGKTSDDQLSVSVTDPQRGGENVFTAFRPSFR